LVHLLWFTFFGFTFFGFTFFGFTFFGFTFFSAPPSFQRHLLAAKCARTATASRLF
jgi:hypothetical protein